MKDFFVPRATRVTGRWGRAAARPYRMLVGRCCRAAAAAFKRVGLKPFGYFCVRDSMSYRSRLSAWVGDYIRRLRPRRLSAKA